MEHIIAIVLVALLIFFVIKVSSVLWRIAGLLFFLALIYFYKDQAIAQVQQFIAHPNLTGIGTQIMNIFSSVFGWIRSALSTVI